MSAGFGYRRVLVMVREGAEAPSFRLAAELAHLLALDLEGLFVENEALLSLAGLPFAREFTLPRHTWQALDAARTLEQFRIAAERAERMLGETAAELGIAAAFSVLRGDPQSALARQARAGDILVLVEPGAAPLHGFAVAESEILWPATAALLLVPVRPGRKRGGIAVLVPADGNGAVGIAAAIARASAEDLVLVGPGDAAPARAAAALRAAGLPPPRLQARRTPSLDVKPVAAALRAAGARLVVLDRAAMPADASGFLARLVAEAGVPALLVGTPAVSPSGAAQQD